MFFDKVTSFTASTLPHMHVHVEWTLWNIHSVLRHHYLLQLPLNLPFSFRASMKACKTFSLISEVLQNPSSAGKGRDVLLALFLSKNYKVYIIQYCTILETGFQNKTLTPDPWSANPLLSPFKINRKKKILKKAQNYRWGQFKLTE